MPIITCSSVGCGREAVRIVEVQVPDGEGPWVAAVCDTHLERLHLLVDLLDDVRIVAELAPGAVWS